MLIAEYLEDLIALRTEQEIKSLIDLIPQKTVVKRGGQELIVPVTDIAIGESVIIKTGSAIPVDGIITNGSATINEASLTGESVAHIKTVHERVFAGTYVEEGSITITADKIGADTFFGKISALVQTAEEKKAKISILTDKVAFYLVPSMLVLIAITWLLTQDLTLVTTLLVFGSPLELTLITPLAILAGIIAAFKNGVLVKGGLVLEKCSRADVIIFDKTGTLTMNEPTVTRIESYDMQYDEKELLTIAAIAEKRAGHVFAKAILHKAAQEGILVPDPHRYTSFAGHGISIVYRNQQWFIGSKHFLQAQEHGAITIPNETETTDASTVYIGSAGKLYGKIYLTDTTRKDAAPTIAALKNMGYEQIMLLSGDKQTIAAQIAAEVGIATAYGDMLPDKKLLAIEELQRSQHVVAMIGDGINDAPALKQADVGIALGAMGMEPAIESADIVLVTNDLRKVVFVCALSKKIFHVIKQNLIYGFILIHGLGIAFAFLGYIDPLKAALFHAVSDLAILINSARLARFTYQP